MYFQHFWLLYLVSNKDWCRSVWCRKWMWWNEMESESDAAQKRVLRSIESTVHQQLCTQILFYSHYVLINLPPPCRLYKLGTHLQRRSQLTYQPAYICGVEGYKGTCCLELVWSQREYTNSTQTAPEIRIEPCSLELCGQGFRTLNITACHSAQLTIVNAPMTSAMTKSFAPCIITSLSLKHFPPTHLYHSQWARIPCFCHSVRQKKKKSWVPFWFISEDRFLWLLA